ncbi:MAG: SPOR domain-containing protein [Flavisolibacter sp.]
MRYIVVIVLIFFINPAVAQDSLNTVVVHKDPRLDLLVKKQSDVNAAIRRASAHYARGFRLLVINTNKREEAIAAKSKIYANFPELKAYLVYQAPYFKLKAGNFRTREEAEQYQKDLSVFFPKGVFIVNDTVEIKPEKETNE